MPDTAPPSDEFEPASVLIVDDSRISALKLAKAMRALGHRTQIAADGVEAMQRLRDGRFDIILLDIVMPRMDGYAVLNLLKADKSLRDLPVIVISSLDDEIGSVAKAIKLGAEDFLPKSFELSILKARLNASLARKRFRDRELDYFHDLEQLTRAAEVIEAGAFHPAELEIDRVADREDPLGRLAVVFRGLAHEIYDRERRLDRTVRTLRGTLIVFAAGGIFGITPALGRMAAVLGTPPLGFVLWANTVAAIICFAIAATRSGWPRLRLAHLRFFAAWAVILGCLYQLLTVVISKHVEASVIALVGSSRGFMVFGLAALMSIERPSLRRFAGLGVGFAAVAAVLMNRGAGGEESDLLWLIAALVLPLLLAIHTLLMTWRPSDLDAFAAVGIMMAVSAILIAPVAYASGDVFWPWDSIGRLQLIILALGAASAIALALALDLVRTAGAVFASQMAYSQTLAGIAWGMLLLDEQLTPAAWGALALVILGFWLVEPRRAGAEFKATVPFSRAPKA